MKPADKHCVVCGRAINWRKKWSRDWEQVKYCSDACRRGLSDVDRTLEQTILDLLDRRKRDETICPSEAARITDPQDWQKLIEPARLGDL